jgi:hypothetical protein
MVRQKLGRSQRLLRRRRRERTLRDALPRGMGEGCSLTAILVVSDQLVAVGPRVVDAAGTRGLSCRWPVCANARFPRGPQTSSLCLARKNLRLGLRALWGTSSVLGHACHSPALHAVGRGQLCVHHSREGFRNSSLCACDNAPTSDGLLWRSARPRSLVQRCTAVTCASSHALIRCPLATRRGHGDTCTPRTEGPGEAARHFSNIFDFGCRGRAVGGDEKACGRGCAQRASGENEKSATALVCGERQKRLWRTCLGQQCARWRRRAEEKPAPW